MDRDVNISSPGSLSPTCLPVSGSTHSTRKSASFRWRPSYWSHSTDVARPISVIPYWARTGHPQDEIISRRIASDSGSAEHMMAFMPKERRSYRSLAKRVTRYRNEVSPIIIVVRFSFIVRIC